MRILGGKVGGFKEKEIIFLVMQPTILIIHKISRLL